MVFAVRPIKAHSGTTEVVDGVGNKIVAVDWNGDINSILAATNGNLDDDNFSSNPAKKLVYSKLALTGAIVDADISPTANIAGSKMLDSSILEGKIPVGGITKARIANNFSTAQYASDATEINLVRGAWTDIAAPQLSVTPETAFQKQLITFQADLALANLDLIVGVGETAEVFLRLLIAGVVIANTERLAARWMCRTVNTKNDVIGGVSCPGIVWAGTLGVGGPFPVKVQYFFRDINNKYAVLMSPQDVGFPVTPKRSLSVFNISR